MPSQQPLGRHSQKTFACHKNTSILVDLETELFNNKSRTSRPISSSSAGSI